MNEETKKKIKIWWIVLIIILLIWWIFSFIFSNSPSSKHKNFHKSAKVLKSNEKIKTINYVWNPNLNTCIKAIWKVKFKWNIKFLKDCDNKCFIPLYWPSDFSFINETVRYWIYYDCKKINEK